MIGWEVERIVSVQVDGDKSALWRLWLCDDSVHGRKALSIYIRSKAL